MHTAPLAVSADLSSVYLLGPLAVIAGCYAKRVRTLASDGRPVVRWRRLCFFAGFVLIAAAVISLGSAGRQLLYVRMIEQLLVGDIAALLIVLGLSGPLIEPLLRVAPFERLRVLAHPVIALPLWVIDLYAWHAPALYQAALRHAGVDALEYACFLGFGVNMWLCLLGPLPMPRWFGSRGELLYVLGARLAEAVLGNIFLWSGTVFYPYYLHGDALHHVSPLADQNIAGGIMVIEASLLTLGLFRWLFVRTAREAEQREELLDYARAHGLELSEARAARAIAAGRGAELRRRVEAAALARPSTPPLDAARRDGVGTANDRSGAEAARG